VTLRRRRGRKRPPAIEALDAVAVALGRGIVATVAHLATGTSLGTARGLLDVAGVRCPAAPLAFFAIAWTRPAPITTASMSERTRVPYPRRRARSRFRRRVAGV